MKVQGLSVHIHDGHGPYLLLVHGMLASRSQFLHNLPTLGKHVTPVTAELLGHSESDSPSDQQCYSPMAYVEAFDAIRSQLRVEEWYVGGCSLGASLTMNYVLAYPDRALGQVFTNSSSAFADKSMSEIWQANSEASYNRITQGGMAAIDRIPVHPKYARRLPTDIREALINDSRNHNVEGIALTMRCTSPFGSIRDRVNEFKGPSLLVCGQFEKRFKSHRQFAEQQMSNLTIVDLEAGHGVNMEASEEFNAAVIDLVESSHS